MNYIVTIKDEWFGIMSGTFEASSEMEAIAEAKDFYAMANDTTENYIEIVSVREGSL